MPKMTVTFDIKNADEAEAFYKKLCSAESEVAWPTRYSVSNVGDSAIVDALSLLLSTLDVWSPQEDLLADIANTLAKVRNHPGYFDDPLKAVEAFIETTGVDPTRDRFLKNFLSEEWHEADDDSRTCIECGDVQSAIAALNEQQVCFNCRDVARPTAVCGCGHPLLWISGGWEHDAAPSLWGDDHAPSADEPVGEEREYWDAEDCVS